MSLKHIHFGIVLGDNTDNVNPYPWVILTNSTSEYASASEAEEVLLEHGFNGVMEDVLNSDEKDPAILKETAERLGLTYDPQVELDWAEDDEDSQPFHLQ